LGVPIQLAVSYKVPVVFTFSDYPDVYHL